MKTPSLLKALYLVVALLAGNAQATLIGDEISASGIGLSPVSATIGAGIEFTFVNLEYFDFAEDTLTISNTHTGHGWGDFLYYTFSGFDVDITGLTIISNSGYSGDPLSDFSFTSDSITLHWGIGQATAGAALVFGIEHNLREPVAQSAQIPEPGMLFLLGLGLAALGLNRKRL